MTSNEDAGSFGGAGLVAVDGAGGVALSDCWALAARGQIPTMAIARAPIVGNQMRDGMAARARLPLRRPPGAVRPFISLAVDCASGRGAAEPPAKRLRA